MMQHRVRASPRAKEKASVLANLLIDIQTPGTGLEAEQILNIPHLTPCPISFQNISMNSL